TGPRPLPPEQSHHLVCQPATGHRPTPNRPPTNDPRPAAFRVSRSATPAAPPAHRQLRRPAPTTPRSLPNHLPVTRSASGAETQQPTAPHRPGGTRTSTTASTSPDAR